MTIGIQQILNSLALLQAARAEYRDPNNPATVQACAVAMSQELQGFGTHPPDADNFGLIFSHLEEAVAKGQAAPTDLISDLEANLGALNLSPTAQGFVFAAIAAVVGRL